VGAVTIDTGRGNLVDFTNGYPDASNAGIVSTLADVSGFSINVTATTVTFEKNGAPDPANCSVSYSYDGGATSTPVIAGTTSGC
jgi:hypothetical protein